MDRRNFIRRAGVSALAVAVGGRLQLVEGTKITNEDTEMNDKGKLEVRHKCRITVLKRECYKDLQAEYLADPKSGPCPYFHEGQEIMVDSDNFFHMLDGKFCSEAWDCISRYVYAALQGGSIMRGWTNDEKTMITCCNDGTRPVIFKLERVDEAESEASSLDEHVGGGV